MTAPAEYFKAKPEAVKVYPNGREVVESRHRRGTLLQSLPTQITCWSEPMPLQYSPSPRFPKGRGKCRECGEPRYREGLCRTHLFAKRRVEYRQQKPPKAKHCAFCGIEFTTTRIQKFCSPRCCDKARLAREAKGARIVSRLARQYKLPITRGMIDAVCERCETPFKHKARSSDRKGRFCSSICFYASNSGSKSPLSRDGVFHLPPNKLWAELCAFIRQRDKVCAACSVPHGKKHHPVDHIIPRRMVHAWGNDPHQICNLVYLCRSCHGRKGMAENKILRGDFVGFVTELKAMNYPMNRVREAFLQFGLPLNVL